ncbi:MAG: DM13 domain-containing protein [Gammaproteobacteria bacterium]
MKRILTALLIGALAGVAGGFALGIFAFPYLFPPPEVNEVVADKNSRAVLAKGNFIHADPNDPVHYGSGSVTIYEGLLHLERDFNVGPGPKYHVYLVPEKTVTPDTAVDKTMYVDLGRLKSFSGSQNYAIPDGVDIKQYPHAVIWCEQFDVLISPAALNPAASL